MRRCDHCQGPLPEGARADARFCGERCRKAAYRERHDPTMLSRLRRGAPEELERLAPQRHCEVCGVPLPWELRRDAHFCSAACRKTAARRRTHDERIRRVAIQQGIPAGVAGFLRRACAYCGVFLTEDKRADSLFCSSRCRKRAHSEASSV